MANITRKKKVRQSISLVLVFMLIITLIPIVPNQAIASTFLEISYPKDTTGVNMGTTESNYVVTSKKETTVSGEYSGIDPSLLRYRVEQKTTGQTYQATLPPIITPPNKFRFDSIPLFPGLNEISITYVSGGTQRIEKIFVFYNDNPNLFNLKINGKTINSDENIINFPVIGSASIVDLYVEGIAPNTNTIIFRNKSILHTHPQAEKFINLGSFSDNFFEMIPMKSGVNDISFELINNSGKKIKVERTVIVNTLSATGLAPYNLQSTYKEAGATNPVITKHVPSQGEVDFKFGETVTNLTKAMTVTAVDNNVRFSGSVIVNGANSLPFNKSLMIGTNRYLNQLDIDIRRNGVSILQGGPISLTPMSKQLSGETGISAQINHIKTTRSTFEQYAISYRDSLPADNLAYTQGDVDRFAILRNSFIVNPGGLSALITNLSTNATALNTHLNSNGMGILATDISNRLNVINTQRDTIGSNLTAINDMLLVDGSAWDWGKATVTNHVNNITTASAELLTELGHLETTINSVIIALETLSTTDRINMRMEDGFPVIDFVTPAIPQERFKVGYNNSNAWNYGDYTIVFIPRIYKNNSINATDYLLDPVNSVLDYRFTFIDLSKKQILGINNFNNNEFILEHNQPYRVDDSIFRIGVYHANLNTAGGHPDRIRVFIRQAPYVVPDRNSFPNPGTGWVIDVPAGEGLNVINLPNLPSGNILMNVYIAETTDSGATYTYTDIMSKQLMVTKTPLVTIQDRMGNFITNNKTYEYNEKAVGSESMTKFLDDRFRQVTIAFQNVAVDPIADNNLGRANNKVKIKINDNPNYEIYWNGTNWRYNNDLALPSFITVTPNSPNPALTSIRLDLLAQTGWLNRAGKNTIYIEFKEGNNTIVNTIDFYILTQGNPIINPFYVATQGVNYFPVAFGEPLITDAERVRIRGSFENADRVEILVNGNTILLADWQDGPPAQWNNTITSTMEYVRIDGFNVETNTTKRHSHPYPDNISIPKPVYQFDIIDLYLDSKITGVNLDIFTIRVEVSKGTATYSENLVIERKRPIFTVLAPYRSVVNNNFQTVIIKSQYATAVKMGKNDLDKVKLERGNSQNRLGEYVLDWIEDHLYDSNYVNMIGEHVFYAEVPLKAGRNNIALTIEMPGVSHKGNIDVFYAALPSVGAVFKTDISKTNINPKELGNQIAITFPKGTILSPKSSKLAGTLLPYNLPDFWHDKSLLIGVADVYTGKVDRDIRRSNVLLRNMLSASNKLDFFNYASNMFYVDAGTINKPGGRLPYEGSMVTSRQERDVIIPSHRGKITLGYNTNIVRDAASHLTVMYHPGYVVDGQMEWVNLGGVVDAGKKQITVPFEDFGYYVVMNLRSTFDDVQFHPWAKRELETMFTKGIMANQTLSRFGSDMPITRGEFITIIVKALNISLDDGPYNSEGAIKFPTRQTFTDVVPNVGLPYWDYKYIETAARAGIVQGIAPRRFAPNDLLTREQAATMLARATEARILRTPEQALTAMQKDFIDANQISYYALQSVQAIAKSGIVVGKTVNNPDGTTSMRFDPHSNLTRAEAATIARRMMQQLKLLPDPL